MTVPRCQQGLARLNWRGGFPLSIVNDGEACRVLAKGRFGEASTVVALLRCHRTWREIEVIPKLKLTSWWTAHRVYTQYTLLRVLAASSRRPSLP